MDLQLKPPPPKHGSLKDICTKKFELFMKEFETITYAVGGTVSAKAKHKKKKKERSISVAFYLMIFN